jgi:Tol biopolymer transport system component
MNADGSGQINLTNNPADDGVPSWSPDGRRIAFVSNRDGNLEIYVMNADGSGVTRLTNNPAGTSGRPGRRMGSALPLSPSAMATGKSTS